METPKLEYISPTSSPSPSPSDKVSSAVSSLTSGVSSGVSSLTSGVSSLTSGVSSLTSGVSSGIESVSSVGSEVSSGVTAGVSSLFDFSSYSVYDVLRLFAIALILSFLGINFFGYLGKVTETVRDLLKPILAFLGYGAAETTKIVALGTKGAVDVASGTVVSGVNVLEKSISKKGTTMNKIDDHTKIDMKLLEKAAQNQNKPPKTNEPEPDDAGSRIQSNKAKNKSGFCYVGEDRGYRRCIAVGEGDKCMSGDIFPTDEICVNPSLRE